MQLLQLTTAKLLPSVKIAMMTLSHFADYKGYVRATREELIEFSGIKQTVFDKAIQQLKRLKIIGRALPKPVMYIILDDLWVVGELPEVIIEILHRKNLQMSTKLVAIYAFSRSTDYGVQYEKLADKLNISSNTLTLAYRSLEWHCMIKRKRRAGYGKQNTIIRRPIEEWRDLSWMTN